MNRDIVWVTLESVRRDRTSEGASERRTTPNLARLASREDAVGFGNAVAHSIWTRPSTASILTGRAPSDHRVWSAEAALPDGMRTVPEQLRDAGYRTVGVSANPQFSPATGLDRGFERFHYLERGSLVREAGFGTMCRYLLNVRRHSAGLTTDTRQHCLGFLHDSIARRHIGRAADDDRPLFLYVHLGDSHHPYCPPKGFRDRFADELALSPADALETVLDASARLHEHIAEGVPFDEERWNALSVLYDTCLAYVDALAGSIVDAASSRLDDPVIVVTADHGEFFGEDDLLAHMLSTHTAVTDVPLVVRGLDERAAANGPVQHADVWATLSGRSIPAVDVPIGRDLVSESPSFAVTQRGGERAAKKVETIAAHNPSFDGDRYGRGPVTSLRTESHRLRRDADGDALFDLRDETTDIRETEPALAAELSDAADEWLRERGQPSAGHDGEATFSSEMERRLEDLGYL
ncbi:sulfatase [Halorubrum lipolyticum]|uniref:Arylsulfatase A family protein n=1 Tax=Halorubrum lipolyticum DSM 21995 TaxID=1227482 RepID=M0P4E7_9EURY|nr:sulfatase [Halorubrum lipolyticum]EMA63700.1 arylsulfatase A family protein [Halorubrum lipolyticum DSM 21995]